MTLAGIELAYLIKEIGKKTEGCYVSNIYGINRNSLLFKMRHPDKPDTMLMISSIGIWTTNKKIDPIEPNKLLRRLRSDLLRSKIEKIEQIGTERIAYLTFSNYDNKFVLIVEFFGEGNMLLCNYNRKILALMHSIDVRHRQLRVGLEYKPPPQDGIDVMDLKGDEFKKILSTSTSIGKIIGRSLGLPKKYVEEIIRLSGIDRVTPSNELSEDETDGLFHVINTTVSSVIDGKHDPTIISDPKESDVFPIRFSDDNMGAREVTSFNDGLDIIFTEEILQKGKSLYSKEAEKRISELQNRLDEQKNAITIVQEKSKRIADVANLLFSMQSEGKTSVSEHTVTEALKKYDAELIREKGIQILKISDAKVKIELDAPLPSIASTLFNESKKQKGAIGSIEKLIKKTEDLLEKTIEKGEIAKGSVSFSDVRKKSWYERYRWFFTSDGMLAVGGRDGSSNSALVRKHMESDDKIFHAEINGSPFFILKDRSEDLMALSLEETAQATVCFSRAWQVSGHGLSSFWVKPDQIKKAAPTGQSMGKGSFMIYGTRNFIKVPSLKLAVGILKQDENFLLVSGPVDPIKKNCLCYVIIEPGGSTISDVAKKIRAEFNKNNDKFQKLFVVDDYVRALPTGSSKITSVVTQKSI